MTSALATYDPAQFQFAVLPEAITAKADALALAAEIPSVVTSPKEQADCIAGAALCKSLIDAMEELRVQAKRRITDEGNLVQAVSYAYKKELVAEKERLEAAAGAWQAEQDRIADEARERLETERRNAIAAQDTERLREIGDRIEMQRLHDEARQCDLAAIAAAPDDAAKEAAQRAADANAEARARKVREEQLHVEEMAEHRADEARARHQEIVLSSHPIRAAGATVRRELDFEVTDIMAVLAARPDLVAVEIRRGLAKTAVNIPGANIPGLRVFPVTKLSAK